MAAPPNKTIHDLSGQWNLNHLLSDGINPAMAIQGLNWIVRAALSRALISLSISQTRDAASGVETLHTVQKSIGRVMEDRRALDWLEVATPHVLFGDVRTKARICAVDEMANPLLREDWEEDTKELIEVQSKGSGWTSWQAWGFQVFGGKRRHVRRAVVQKDHQFDEIASEYAAVRMVYDWVHAQEVRQDRGI